MGGGVIIIGGPYSMRSSIFFDMNFLLILKFLFVSLECITILKTPLEEDFASVASSHILFTYSDFIFLLCLPILKFSCV